MPCSLGTVPVCGVYFIEAAMVHVCGALGSALLASTLDGSLRELWRLHSAKAGRCSSRCQACRLVQTPCTACQVQHRYCTTSDGPKARASVGNDEHRGSSSSLTDAVPGT